MSLPEIKRLDNRVKIWLLLVSLLTLVFLVLAALRENVSVEWRQVRLQYAEILRTKATTPREKKIADQFEVRLVQNYVPGLKIVDRCTTCHAGINDPRMTDQAQPFTSHPGDYLLSHPPEKFGCTSCHAGQGRATESIEAHRGAEFWDTPMYEKKYMSSNCAQCHSENKLHDNGGLFAQAAGSAAVAEGSELVMLGRELVQNEGCLGCHTLRGKGGGGIGPDITRVGEKAKHDLDFTHLIGDGHKRVEDWHQAHFKDPANVSPGSLMPKRDLTPKQVDALTAYVLTLRRALPPGEYNNPAIEKPVEHDGKSLFLTYCSACHGPKGRGTGSPDLSALGQGELAAVLKTAKKEGQEFSGGVKGIVTPRLNNSDALAVADDNYYRFIIAHGRSTTKMPAWKQGSGNLTRPEIDRVVAYIRSWEPEAPALRDINVRAGNPRMGKAFYAGRCRNCHGVKGRGGIGPSLNSSTFLSVASDRFLAKTIIHGRQGTAMPSWKNFTAEDVSDIIAYIRKFSRRAPSWKSVTRKMKKIPHAERLEYGQALYANNCAGCHSKTGAGGIGPSLSGQNFLRVVDDEYLYRAIVEGRPDTAMPAWGHLRNHQVAALVTYLASWRKGAPINLKKPHLRGDYALGNVHFQTACMRCHGEAGRGGSAPRIAGATFLKGASDAQLYQWIAHGRNNTAMLGFLQQEQGVTTLRPGQIVDVIAYLRYTAAQPDAKIRQDGAGDARLGREIYGGNCAGCHGQKGEGGTAPQLNNPQFLKSASDGFLAATIVLGRDGTAMTSMIHGKQGIAQIPPKQVQDVIAYLRTWGNPAAKKWRKSHPVAEMSARAIYAGTVLFKSNCSRCHGPNGRGQQDGPQYIAPSLNNREFLRAASDGFLQATIARGRQNTAMLPFGNGAGGISELSGENISDIVSYIRSWEDQYFDTPQVRK